MPKGRKEIFGLRLYIYFLPFCPLCSFLAFHFRTFVILMDTTTLEVEKPATPLAHKPKWIRVKLPTGKKYTELRGVVEKYKLHTICTSGSCPNMGECWGEGTATFMILGNICTRSCGFCGVKTGRPETIDWAEPEKVARSIKLMNIKHAVVTSVDRDDLKDMGSII